MLELCLKAKWVVELLYKYEDDCTNVVEKLTLRTLWDNNTKRLVHTEEQENKDRENNITEQQVTARAWREMASSLVKGIKFTTDCPDQHNNNMVPILAFQGKIVTESAISNKCQERYLGSFRICICPATLESNLPGEIFNKTATEFCKLSQTL